MLFLSAKMRYHENSFGELAKCNEAPSCFVVSCLCYRSKWINVIYFLTFFRVALLLYVSLVEIRIWCWISGSPCASYQIRKIACCACAGNTGNVFHHRRLQRKPLVSDPGIHHGTCVTHVPWCMSGSLTSGGGENVPGIPGACAPTILCILQEAHYRNPMIAKGDQ